MNVASLDWVGAGFQAFSAAHFVRLRLRHRVLGIEFGRFRIRGENAMPSPDDPVWDDLSQAGEV